MSHTGTWVWYFVLAINPAFKIASAQLRSSQSVALSEKGGQTQACCHLVLESHRGAQAGLLLFTPQSPLVRVKTQTSLVQSTLAFLFNKTVKSQPLVLRIYEPFPDCDSQVCLFILIDALIDPAKLPALSGSLFWGSFWAGRPLKKGKS